jgi:DNA replication protein DnaC
VKNLDPNPKACRLLTDPEMERLRRTGATQWLDPSTGCITCGGARSFKGIDGEMYHCDCTQQWILYHWFLNSGLSQEFQRLAFDDMTHVDADAKNAIFEYADNLEYNVRTNRGLILWAKNPGTGKTLLATWLVKYAMAAGYDCHFVQFNEMIDIFTAGWRDEEERAWFIRRVRNVPLLVVDDIGKELDSRGVSGMVTSMVDMVMRHRVASGLPTIITTNLTPVKIKNSYGEYVVDLLAEQCSMVEVPGKGYRTQKAIENERNAREQMVRPIVPAFHESV